MRGNPSLEETVAYLKEITLQATKITSSSTESPSKAIATLDGPFMDLGSGFKV